MTIYRCTHCNGTNLTQSASVMLNPNSPDLDSEIQALSAGDLQWDDFYYCEDCKDETQAEEEEE